MSSNSACVQAVAADSSTSSISSISSSVRGNPVHAAPAVGWFESVVARLQPLQRHSTWQLSEKPSDKGSGLLLRKHSLPEQAAA